MKLWDFIVRWAAARRLHQKLMSLIGFLQEEEEEEEEMTLNADSDQLNQELFKICLIENSSATENQVKVNNLIPERREIRYYTPRPNLNKRK